MPEFWPDYDRMSQDQRDRCHFLLPKQIQMIDEALASVGEFGEVRLVVEKGRLRYMITLQSHDTLKWHPGSLVNDLGT